MPRPAPTETSQKPPNPDTLFTDREREREVLHKVLRPQPTPPDHPELFITVFYGAGGVGKSALGARAREIAAKHNPVVLVTVDFDTNAWTIDSPFVAVAGELVRAFTDERIPAPLSTVLLTLHSLHSMPSGEGAGKKAQELGLEILDKGVELSQGVPGLGILLKLGKWMYDRTQRKQVETKAQDLGLWPVERGGRIDLIDLEKKIANALFEDLRTFLTKHDERHVRVLLDGFERLQSYEGREDVQMRLQEFLGYCASSDDRAAFDRLRVIVLSREKLRWDALYEPDWGLHWQQHLLNGLGEPDAREYLGRWQAWFSGNKQAAVALALANAEDDILRASDESISGERAFSPFYLTLAVDLVERSVLRDAAPDLGKTPAELQNRFLRLYLGRAECRALMVLALAGVFDEALFDWLADQRVIEFAVHSFHTALRQDHSYFQTAGPDSWRFHRLFEKALQSRWTVDDAARRECRAIIQRLLDYYAAPLLQTPERDWTDKEVNAWTSGMEIITAQGLEAGLLPYEEWESLTLTSPWSSKSYKCASAMLSFLRRVLAAQETLKGPEHHDTLTSLGYLASLLNDKGDSAAEPLYRRALEVRERVLGPEHRDTLMSVNNLAFFLNAKGDLAGAEPLFHRALEACERVLGPEHPDTLTSVSNLASVLDDKGDWAAAEPLYRRALEVCERVLGPEHPDTLTSVSNLAFLLDAKGDWAAAEPLYRRALEVRERVLGPEHPDTLTSVNNLASFLNAKGDRAAAEPLYRRALEVSERILGPEHRNTLTFVSNLALLLDAKGDRAAAEPLYRRALESRERVLGAEHPDTLTSVNNLAGFLDAKGDRAAAEPLYRRALESRERVLGAEHPDTLLSVTTLACLERDKGDSAAAESLFRRALETRQRVLGPDHPDTLKTGESLQRLIAKKA
jgi:tetratricopeptide (TPR) repeat protein